MTDAATIEALADQQAIRDQIYRYCRAMDRIDAELGYSVWHEDGLADYGEAIFRGTGRGFVDFVCEAHRGLLHHSHQVTNILIDLDGDAAASEAYVHATLRMEAEGQIRQMTTWARYLDRWSKRGGRWAIDQRVTIIDFDEIRDVTTRDRPTRGTRDRSDPSYAVLAARR